MKKLKYITFTLIVIFINILFAFNVNAVETYNLSIDAPSSVTKGSNITLTFYARNLSSIKNGYSGYSGVITYDSSRLEFIDITSSINGWNVYKSTPENKITFLGYDDNPPENTKREDSEIFKVQFKVKSLDAVNTKIEVSNIKGTTSIGESLIASPITKTITIKEVETKKSNDSYLSKLSVSNHNISPSFDPNTTSYKLTVDNSVKNLTVNATPNDNKANVSISGNNNLSVGKNNIIVEVQAEDGTKKLYKIEVTRNPAKNNENNTSKKSNNNNLESISGIPNLVFDPNTTDYDVIVPFEVTNINTSAKPANSKAKVTISNGNLKNLEVNKSNVITIAVTAEDSSVKVYTINVKRSSYKSDTDLKELTVNDKNILDKKDKDGSYKITVDKDVNKLDISAIPVSDTSTVKIEGNKELKPGSNTVLVTVTDKNGFTKSYTIEVDKKGNHFLLNYLKDYYLLLIAIIFTILLILLMLYLNKKNKDLIDEFNKKKELSEKENNMFINTKLEPALVDNNSSMLYNEDNNTYDDIIVPSTIPVDDGNKDSDMIQAILDDESVSEVQKEVKIIRNEKLGDEDVEREYTITENYRKK